MGRRHEGRQLTSPTTDSPQGYAVANSNMGHDAGAEPGAWFGYNNRQAEIDFAYRAVHLDGERREDVIKAYYDHRPDSSFFEGCSTGGRKASWKRSTSRTISTVSRPAPP